ncbi:MAG: hypothetical protein ACLGQX_02705 [Acidobacteriota bacterium]
MRRRQRRRPSAPAQRVLNPYSRMVAHFAYVQPSERWTEWSFRLISARQAQAMVDCGEAVWVSREVTTPQGEPQVQPVGIRALQPTNWEHPTPCTLTVATTHAVALAADGRQRLTRRQRAEVLRFKVWPLIGDSKAVAVRPRISAEDRRVAENLLHAAGRRRQKETAQEAGQKEDQQKSSGKQTAQKETERQTGQKGPEKPTEQGAADKPAGHEVPPQPPARQSLPGSAEVSCLLTLAARAPERL